MSCIRHPRMRTPEGLTLFLTELEEYKKSAAYQASLRQSEKRTEERTQLKRKRTDARFRLKLGQRDANQNRDTELAKSFRTGDLTRECAAAEAEYRARKLEGTARSLGSSLASESSVTPPRLEPAGVAVVGNKHMVLAGKAELCLSTVAPCG